MGPLKKLLPPLRFLAVLYLFFLCIELIGCGFKCFGEGWAQGLFSLTHSPIVGLLIGVLSTSLMQSSSSTTSIVVGLVGGGTLGVTQAIPIVMGANIGTTITNSIVALGHIQRRKEFVLAFSGATVHDFFNMCTVVVLLPLEVMFHPIEKTATLISGLLVGMEGTSFQSPFKMIVMPVAAAIRDFGEQVFHSKELLGATVLVLTLVMLIFALAQMVKIMRGALAAKLEVLIDQYVFTSTLRALLFGMLVTAVVQSSSVTCSLMVPLLGVGIVKMEQIFPYVVGANIGTTVTALLASLVTGNPAALTLAFAHLVFNLFGMAIFLPLRKIPIFLANWLGNATAKRRWVALVYVLLAFFVVPGILILVF